MNINIIDKLKEFENKKVLVVGDIMLDHYIEGNVSRICPEAPIPILDVVAHKYDLGGAANAAKYLASLGACVTLYGVVGKDNSADKILNLCNSWGIKFEGIEDALSVTTTKHRGLNEHNHQIMFRWDEENHSKIDDFDKKKLEKLVLDSDSVIISDYGKGFVSYNLAQFVISLNSKTIVDPKNLPWDKYSGSYIIKPNKKEFSDYYRSKNYSYNYPYDYNKTYNELALELDANLIVTLGEEGMELAEKNAKETLRVSTRARKVSDVTGAGDMVSVVLALCAAVGISLEDSMDIANHAAAIKVGRMGTSYVTLPELTKELSDCYLEEKIFYFSPDNELNLFSSNKKVVFTNGCFDLLHDGHVELLKQAKKQGDFLVVGINSDLSVKRLKGESRPIQNEKVRSKVLASIKYVDAVVVFNEDTPLELIKTILPDILVKGSDYNVNTIIGAKEVIDNGGKIVTIDLIEGSSTSSIVKKILKSY